MAAAWTSNLPRRLLIFLSAASLSSSLSNDCPYLIDVAIDKVSLSWPFLAAVRSRHAARTPRQPRETEGTQQGSCRCSACGVQAAASKPQGYVSNTSPVCSVQLRVQPLMPAFGGLAHFELLSGGQVGYLVVRQRVLGALNRVASLLHVGKQVLLLLFQLLVSFVAPPRSLWPSWSPPFLVIWRCESPFLLESPRLSGPLGIYSSAAFEHPLLPVFHGAPCFVSLRDAAVSVALVIIGNRVARSTSCHHRITCHHWNTIPIPKPRSKLPSRHASIPAKSNAGSKRPKTSKSSAGSKTAGFNPKFSNG